MSENCPTCGQKIPVRHGRVEVSSRRVRGGWVAKALDVPTGVFALGRAKSEDEARSLARVRLRDV